ncbi:MAG: hypothetical protein RL418_1 [Actinomycetota bacterium]|jgi:hypothetical protein
MAEFMDWLDENISPVRKEYGFRAEFRLVDHAKNQYVWCVSLEGDQHHFEEVQASYNASSGRAKAFEIAPDLILSSEISFVEALDLPK